MRAAGDAGCEPERPDAAAGAAGEAAGAPDGHGGAVPGGEPHGPVARGAEHAPSSGGVRAGARDRATAPAAAGAARPSTAPGRVLELLPFLLTLTVVGLAWAPSLPLHLSGEDFTLLARIERGLEASPHVFRPLVGWWLGALHALFGAESGLPYHAASLALHLANTALVFVLGRRLFGSPWTAGACAALFGLGAGVRDALFWVAAVNRPLSTFGALAALVGLTGLLRGERRAALCLGAGLLWQFAANEDFYGTALLVAAWCGWAVLRSRRPVLPPPRPDEEERGASRAAALASGALALALLGVHYLAIHRVPGGADAVLDGAGRVLDSARTRSDAIAGGLGFPAPFGLALPLLGSLALLATGRRAVAAFVLGAWLASFVPFVLSDAVGYRFYPTQAPVALAFAGGLVTLFAKAFPWRAVAPVAWGALLVLALLGSRAPRARGLVRWHEALAEIRVCEAPLRALAERQPDEAPISVNIETTTMGLVYYLWPSLAEPSDVRYFGFLDAASAYVPPVDPPAGTWFGRRLEGSFGVIEPERYFARRPALEPFRLYRAVERVASLAEARARLCDPALDLATTALVEPAGEIPTVDPAANAGARLAILEPFTVLVPNHSGRMRIAVASGGAVVFAVQDGWLYDPLFRLPLDQQIFSGLREGRCFALEAKTAAGEELPTFPLNAYGLGVLVPAGEHTVEVRFRRRAPDELR